MSESSISAGGATDVGRVRDHNEDAYLVTDGVYAVADGMGGHAAGEVASALAIEPLAELAERAARKPIGSGDVIASIEEANERILRSVAEAPERRGMGTTLTGLARVDVDGAETWAVFNVGDSRVYRLCAGVLEQLTVDHSEVQELVDAGLITASEAAVHPARNIITRSLGMDASPDPDLSVLETSADPADEVFVICSDGLTNEVDEGELTAILTAEQDPQTAAERLCQAANANGGRDNVTVVVVRDRGGRRRA